MNKVDTVSLVNMILPKPDVSKTSWGESAFKDIFSMNNSNNKNKQTTNDVYKSKVKEDESYTDKSKVKYSKAESVTESKDSKSKVTREESGTEGKVDKGLETENIKTNENPTKKESLETSKVDSVEQKETQTDGVKVQSDDALKQINDLIVNLINVDLNPEQSKKLEQAINLLPSEIKALVQENPKLALDFLKDNLGFVAKSVDLPIEQLKNIEQNINSMLEVLDSNEGVTLEKLVDIQKIQNLNLNNKIEPQKDIVRGNIDDINFEISSLRLESNKQGQQNPMPSNAFAEKQSEFLEFTQSDKNQAFDLAGSKVFSNSILLNASKKVDIKPNQFMQMISKIADEIRLNVVKNKNEMTIKLQPETLGKLTVKISSENGILNASFFAENDKAKAIIENHMVELKNTLEKQGIQVENLSVSVDQNQDELSKHRNIMEAQKYNKAQINIADFELLDDVDLDNPYVLDDMFTELI